MKTSREGLVSEYITEALLRLLKQKDFSSISITDICNRAGTTRMSFYRNFESKEDIIRKWLQQQTDSFLERSGISYSNDTTEDYIIKLFTHLSNYKEEFTALYNSGLSHLVKDEFDRVFLSIHQGEYDDYKTFFHAGGIYNSFYLWMRNGFKESPQELAQKMEGLLSK